MTHYQSLDIITLQLLQPLFREFSQPIKRGDRREWQVSPVLHGGSTGPR
jgi:hypothetical protein